MLRATRLRGGHQGGDRGGEGRHDPTAGKPIVQFLRFHTGKQGDGILLLRYVRSWEKPAPGETQFDLRVVVE